MAKWYVAAFVLGPVLGPVPCHAQKTTVTIPCDPSLVVSTSDPLAYGRRGDRCEGVFEEKKAGGGELAIVAFTVASKSFAIAKDRPIHLEWPLSDSEVFLRAVGLDLTQLYRMDSTRPPNTTSFDWSTDILTQLRIKEAEEIGLVAWMRGTIANRPEAIYVPLRVGGAAPASGAGGNYVVVVVPGTPLKELFLSLSVVDAAGKDRAVVASDRPLKRGSYPAGYPIPVLLPSLPEAGLYRLELNAVLEQGAPLPRSLYFRHFER